MTAYEDNFNMKSPKSATFGENLSIYKKYLTVRKNCIVCNSAKHELWAEYDFFKAVQCCRCGFVWIRPFLNKYGLKKYYQGYIGMRFEDKIKTEQRKIQYRLDKRFIENFISSGRVLDIGCSGGFFLNVLSKKFEKHGIEIDSEAVNYARKTYSFGENVLCVELLKVPYGDIFFDLVVMRGLIEHLPDPVSAIGKISRLLKTNGYLFIAATPNANSFCANLYREKWNLFHPIRHIFYFNPENLSKICSKYRLRLIAQEFPYFKTPYANPEEDIQEVAKVLQLKQRGEEKEIKRSPPFWENMMNLVFKKL